MMLNTTEYTVLFIIGVAAAFYARKRYNEVSYVKSSVDDNQYIVQNKKDKQRAANILARLNKKIKALIAHVKQNHPDRDGVSRLADNYDPSSISEGTEDSNYTSYSVNKGEKIVFCLRQRDDKNEDDFVNENVLVYVATHELGHLMTKEIGHTKSFWDNFKFLLQEAENIDLYKKVDYAKSPVRYCGLSIRHSII